MREKSFLQLWINMEINRESVKPKLVRFAHYWNDGTNDGTMEYWVFFASH